MRWGMVTIVALLLFMFSAPARAGIDRKETHELVDGMHIDVDVYPTVDIAMKFPTRVLRAVPANGEKYSVDLDDKKLTLIVETGAVITSLHIKLEGGEDVAILVKPAKSPKQVILSHVFRYPAVKLQRVPVCTAEPKEAEQATSEREVDAMSERFELGEPMSAEFVQDGFHLSVETTQLVYEGSDLKFRIKIRNLGAQSYPIATVQVLDVDAVEYEEVDTDTAESLPLTLGPEREANSSIVIRQPYVLGAGWQLRLIPDVQGIPPAIFRVTPMQTTWPTQPLTRERGPLEGRAIVTMQAIGGGTNLDDGLGVGLGAGRTAWAMLHGVGGYASIGQFEHASLDGGADISFANTATIESAQGTVNTSAWGARLHVGGRLHTGRRIISYVRLGLGIAVAKHEFEAAGNTDSELRLAGLLMFGGGVDWLVSRRFLLGLAISANGPIFGQDTGLAFESVLRAGMAFELPD